MVQKFIDRLGAQEEYYNFWVLFSNHEENEVHKGLTKIIIFLFALRALRCFYLLNCYTMLKKSYTACRHNVPKKDGGINCLRFELRPDVVFVIKKLSAIGTLINSHCNG